MSVLEEEITSSFCEILSAETSAAPVEFANRLFVKNIISKEQHEEALHQSTSNYSKASKLVRQVINKMSTEPEKFEDLLNILHSFCFMKRTTEAIERAYKDGGTKDIRNSTHQQIQLKIQRLEETIQQFKEKTQQLDQEKFQLEEKIEQLEQEKLQLEELQQESILQLEAKQESILQLEVRIELLQEMLQQSEEEVLHYVQQELAEIQPDQLDDQFDDQNDDDDESLYRKIFSDIKDAALLWLPPPSISSHIGLHIFAYAKHYADLKEQEKYIQEEQGQQIQETAGERLYQEIYSDIKDYLIVGKYPQVRGAAVGAYFGHHLCNFSRKGILIGMGVGALAGALTVSVLPLFKPNRIIGRRQRAWRDRGPIINAMF